jgi:hypothetical protein
MAEYNQAVMTPALRRTHRIAWFSLALLLPVAWLAAVLVVPDKVCQEPARAPRPAPLGSIVQSKQSENLLLNLRRDAAGSRHQLEILITKPLTSANAVVWCKQEDHPDKQIGLLGARGVYRFDLDSTAIQTIEVNVTDELKKQQLATLKWER